MVGQLSCGTVTLREGISNAAPVFLTRQWRDWEETRAGRADGNPNCATCWSSTCTGRSWQAYVPSQGRSKHGNTVRVFTLQRVTAQRTRTGTKKQRVKREQRTPVTRHFTPCTHFVSSPSKQTKLHTSKMPQMLQTNRADAEVSSSGGRRQNKKGAPTYYYLLFLVCVNMRCFFT